jgi:hypothetical protein
MNKKELCTFCGKANRAGYFLVCSEKHFTVCHKTCKRFNTKCGVCANEIIGLTQDSDVFSNEKMVKNMKATWKRNKTRSENDSIKSEFQRVACYVGFLRESYTSMSGGYVIAYDSGYSEFREEWWSKRKKGESTHDLVNKWHTEIKKKKEKERHKGKPKSYAAKKLNSRLKRIDELLDFS